jgi:hypothetical protein
LRCPNCYSEIAPAPRCPRCEWPLQPAGAPAHSNPVQPAVDQWGNPTPPAGPPAPGSQGQPVPPPVPQQPAAGAESVPLTGSQKRSLLSWTISPALLIVIAPCFLWVLYRDASGVGRAVLFLIIVPGLLAYVIYQSLPQLRDLHSGVALVRVALVRRTWDIRSNMSTMYYAEFEGLGRMALFGSVHAKIKPDNVYRISYSPASKVVWSAESVIPGL